MRGRAGACSARWCGLVAEPKLVPEETTNRTRSHFSVQIVNQPGEEVLFTKLEDGGTYEAERSDPGRAAA